MSVCTKTGDGGTTFLYSGKRVLKSDRLIEVYGQLDELSSFIGLTIAKINSSYYEKILTTIQKDLYLIMSFLSEGKFDLNFLAIKTEKIEKEIRKLEKKLPQLTRFLLPQGNEISCILHITRTVCRRAERVLVRSFQKENYLEIDRERGKIIAYINRLSDFLFLLARFFNNNREVII